MNSGVPRRFVLNVDGSVIDGPAVAVYPLPQAGATLIDLWRSAVLPVDNAVVGDPTTTADFELMPSGMLFRWVQIDPTGSDEPMWHQTTSTDFTWILQGEVVLMWRGGETLLKAGQSCVVRGTEHAWANRTSEPMSLVTVAVAAVEDSR